MVAGGSGERMAWWLSLDGSPAEDLAREELLLEGAAAGIPILFCYGWQGPVLVLGYGQAEGDVDLAACRRGHISVLRRCSGGTAVLHQGDLSASLALPAAHPWARSIPALYDGFVLAVQGALAGQAVSTVRFQPSGREPRRRSPVCFEDHRAESLLVGGRKVLGCAQTRRRGAALVHGTLLFTLDAALQARVYGVPAARIEAAMAPLPPRPGLHPRAVAEALAEVLAGALGVAADGPQPPPRLPDGLQGRLADPKWVVVRAEPAP